MRVRRILGAGLAAALFGLVAAAAPAQAPGAPEERSFRTADGVKLRGLFYKSPKGAAAPVVIMLHAYKANPDEAIWAETAKQLVKQGFHVFRFDFRGHGKSTDVVPDEFWANRVNKALVRVSPGSTAATDSSIKFEDFRDSYYPMLVQDLAGLSYSLSAAAQTEASPAAQETLERAAAGTRDSMRQLRSLLVEIHPPNLRASGLEAALTDLLAPLRARGIDTELTVEPDLALDEEAERLVYRAAAEALRNVQRHAQATSVRVAVTANGGDVRLEVADDGRGFTQDERERSRDDGHVGLSLLDELAGRAGGRLDVRSAPDGGTTFELELPQT